MNTLAIILAVYLSVTLIWSLYQVRGILKSEQMRMWLVGFLAVCIGYLIISMFKEIVLVSGNISPHLVGLSIIVLLTSLTFLTILTMTCCIPLKNTLK